MFYLFYHLVASCTTLTTEGNSKGRPCLFPFTYKGRVHYSCLPTDDNKSWCSTTENFDVHGLWGICNGNNR